MCDQTCQSSCSLAKLTGVVVRHSGEKDPAYKRIVQFWQGVTSGKGPYGYTGHIQLPALVLAPERRTVQCLTNLTNRAGHAPGIKGWLHKLTNSRRGTLPNSLLWCRLT